MNINKLFRFNRYNNYTHIDLRLIKEYNLIIKLICDNKLNYLYYKRESLILKKVLK